MRLNTCNTIMACIAAFTATLPHVAYAQLAPEMTRD